MSDDIAQWLEGLGLGQYAQAFTDNDIEFKNLRRLTEDDLKELGLRSSRSIGAIGPSRRRPPVKVVVFQRPCGTALATLRAATQKTENIAL